MSEPARSRAVLSTEDFKLIRKATPGRAATDTVMLWVPVFGNLIRKTTTARFTRTLGTLISSGVPILTAGSSVTWTYKLTNTGNVDFAKADLALVVGAGPGALTPAR